jgi:hypothetical protein
MAAALVVLVPVEVWAACTGASPRWASSADYTSLCGCIKGATAGDTITVTGDATWTTYCEFTRGVNLVGVGNPTITGKTLMLWWHYNAAAQTAHDTLTIKGFTFDADEASQTQLSDVGIITLGYTTGGNYVSVVIVGNIFKNTEGRGIYNWGRTHGVISQNTFDRVRVPFGLYGGNHDQWLVDTQAFGGDQQVYFEGNLIQYSSAFPYSPRAVSGGNGGQGVIRYNDWNMHKESGTGDDLWELHGLQPMFKSDGVTYCGTAVDCDLSVKKADSYSNMNSEWYGNNIYGVNTGQWMMELRGGWALLHHNAYAATSGSGYGITYKEYSCDITQRYYATHGSFVMHIANTYVWNNFDKGTRFGPINKNFDLCADNVTPTNDPNKYTITENVDYWNDKYATFDGTSGVGCGTIAARPATCTTGVGYWVTDQSCTSLTGMIGRSPTTPISGALYKCTATNTWTSYYTPYTYPHPLVTTLPAPAAVRVK